MKSSVEIIEARFFARAVADELKASIDDVLSGKDYCSLVLAGGKTPSSIYRLLSRPPDVQELEWEKLRLYWGDERWVPKEDLQSNFRLVNETLLSQLSAGLPKVYPIDTTCASAEESARNYSELIEKNECLNSERIPKFDIVLLGIGEDGHTASLFPGSEALSGEQSHCIAVKNPNDGSQRLSLSPKALFSAEKVFFIVKGENKASVTREVLEGTADVSSIPARLYNTASGKVTFFLDTAAASKLQSYR